MNKAPSTSAARAIKAKHWLKLDVVALGDQLMKCPDQHPWIAEDAAEGCFTGSPSTTDMVRKVSWARDN